jgi:hypothetical protein
MLAFDIYIGEERLCLAGVDDWSLLSAHVTAQRGDSSSEDSVESLELSMGGMTQPDAENVYHHVRWGRVTELKVGTKITIHVVETDTPERPIRRYRSDHEVQEQAFTEEEIEELERQDWLRLKAKFEPHERSARPAPETDRPLTGGAAVRREAPACGHPSRGYNHGMAGLWREIVDVIDSEISVRDDRFITDLRFLVWLPAIPFMIALCFVDLPSRLGYALVGLMFGFMVPWAIFLFRRRAAKKRTWTEPTRWSDENNGY